MKKTSKLQVLILALAPSTLFAHEGHGHLPGSHPLHYLAEPFHALVLLVALSAIAGVVFYMRKSHKKS